MHEKSPGLEQHKAFYQVKGQEILLHSSFQLQIPKPLYTWTYEVVIWGKHMKKCYENHQISSLDTNQGL